MSMSGGVSSSDDDVITSVEILEQPKSHGYRFRYDCEGKTAGCLVGERSTKEKKTSPSFKLNNLPSGHPVIVVISCVTAEPPYRPHPHKLVGKDCEQGVCTITLKRTSTAILQHIGVQCVKKKEVQNSLSLREQIKVNPYNSDAYYDPDYMYDLKKVRLAIQPFITDKRTGQHILVPPMVTNPIHDQKGENELVICRTDRKSGQARGGDEVFLLCEKVNKDDIAVQFYDDQGWAAWGDFSAVDVHKQFAIVFKTPKYKSQQLPSPKEVHMRLYRPSDDMSSKPIPFFYTPNETDPFGLSRKRKRREPLNLPGPQPNIPQLAAFGGGSGASQNGSVKEENKQTLLAEAQMKQILQLIQQQPNQDQSLSGTDSNSPSPGPSHTVTSSVQYPKMSEATTVTGRPNLEELVPSLSVSTSTSTSLPAPIPAFVNQMDTGGGGDRASQVPTMLPGATIGAVTTSQPLRETTLRHPVAVSDPDPNPQYLFSAMTTPGDDFSGLLHDMDSNSYELVLQPGDSSNDTDLMQYLNPNMLETDGDSLDGGFDNRPNLSSRGQGRRSTTSQRQQTDVELMNYVNDEMSRESAPQRGRGRGRGGRARGRGRGRPKKNM